MSLSPEQVAGFHSDGYLALSDALVPEAIGELRQLLDPLFDDFTLLPQGAAQDLAGREPGGMPPRLRSPEINRVLRLKPELSRTLAFRRCQEIANALAGRSTRYSFDHAIYKQPFNETATPWHQDQAYTGHRRSLRTLHFWIPLQDATVENGCMHFVPGSHALGLVPHQRSAPASPTLTAGAGKDVLARAVACPVPVGGLTVHTPLTLHYTGPNRTAEARRAWILHFGPFGRWAKLHPGILLERLQAVLN